MSVNLGGAKAALIENIDRHITKQRDPAAYNLSVALLGIARALEELAKDLRSVQSDVGRLEHEVRSLRR